MCLCLWRWKGRAARGSDVGNRRTQWSFSHGELPGAGTATRVLAAAASWSVQGCRCHHASNTCWICTVTSSLVEEHAFLWIRQIWLKDMNTSSQTVTTQAWKTLFQNFWARLAHVWSGQASAGTEQQRGWEHGAERQAGLGRALLWALGLTPVLSGLLWGLIKVIHVKHLAWCLVHGKFSAN